ncbi:NADPH-dependent FMN reductase [Flavobacterium sp. GCM10027622]|uniref:NADPH-dependent FMN reductase n=1 Tax=unclassified Flavobacterium TaxID=196869 RepID=UPI00360905AC
MKIVAFGASYSKQSINKKLAGFVAHQFENTDIEILDLNDYVLPVFSVDVENETGHPEIIQEFIKKLDSADLIIISMAEHNGSYTAAFKNLFDWTSRVKLNMFENKKLLLLSTSPGGRGAESSLKTALERFPRHGATILNSYSLPNFHQNFDAEKGIVQEEKKAQLVELLHQIKSELLH